MNVKELYLKSKDNNRLAINIISGAKDKVIIICPGFFQSKDTPTFGAIANSFGEDFDIISVDMRGHGRSGGLCTFGVKEEEDLSVIIDYARERYKRIGMLAFSLGALACVNYVSGSDRVNSLVLVSAPMAFEEIENQFWKPSAVKTGLRGLEKSAGARLGNPFLDKKKPIEVIGKVSPTPVLFIHGQADPIVSVRHSRALYKAAGEPKKLVIFDKGSHAQELFQDCKEKFVSEIQAWFKKTL